MSDQAEVNRRHIKRPKADQRNESVQGLEDMAGDMIQDQIIIAPEIMGMILEQLDLRSLKKVRLVCKSWLREAQDHIRRRAVVRFQRDGFVARISSFFEAYQKHSAGALPKPFYSIDINLENFSGACPRTLPQEQLEALRPRILLTRFSPASLPLQLALPLIIQSSASLEYLWLEAGSCQPGYDPPMDPNHSFPKLRHVSTEIWADVISTPETQRIHFPSIAAWIINASPNLETFESRNGYSLDLASELLLKIKVQKVKTLILWSNRLSSEAAEHFLSIPFSRLQNLRLKLHSGRLDEYEDLLGWKYQALDLTLKKSVQTLETLDIDTSLSEVEDDYDERVDSELVVCPKVHELTLQFLRYSKKFISDPFPNLRVLNVSTVDVDLLVSGDLWSKLPPFLGLKTLRIQSCIRHGNGGYGDSRLIPKFFDKFPSLERVRLEAVFLLYCCGLKATGKRRFLRLLEGVKHLELAGDPDVCIQNASPKDCYSTLAVLKGIEAITLVSSNEAMRFVPFRELAALKVVQFPWGDWLNVRELLKIAARVEKVIITNCCSIPRVKGGRVQNLLEEFFKLAPNAECGCEANGKGMPDWYY